MRQTRAEADRNSAGCLSCHTTLDAPTMHLSPAVHLGCTDCHGGNANAHGPNEFVDLRMGVRVTACVAEVLADHYRRDRV